jgi:hypothetical protein
VSTDNPLTHDEALRLLDEAQSALRALSKACLVAKPHLDKPFTDAPEHSPWSLRIERYTRRAYDLGTQIRQQLKADGREVSR